MGNMLRRAFGAPSFAGFWRHWNPIFGYGLLRFIYAPLRQFLPASLTAVLTFAFCGALHDVVTMAVRRAAAFLFTPWFILMGIAVVATQALGMNLARQPPLVRGLANLACIVACLAATIILRRRFDWP